MAQESLEEGFRGPQVCKIVGITYRQLDYWARTDLIRPSVRGASGSGSQRRYSYGDLVEFKVIKNLLDAGVLLKQARVAVDYLREHLGADIGTANLVLNGRNPVLVRSDGELIDVLRAGQGVLNVVPLAGVKGALDAAIHELRPKTTGDGSLKGDLPATASGG